LGLVGLHVGRSDLVETLPREVIAGQPKIRIVLVVMKRGRPYVHFAPDQELLHGFFNGGLHLLPSVHVAAFPDERVELLQVGPCLTLGSSDAAVVAALVAP